MDAAFLGAVVGSGLTIVAQWLLGPRIERRVRAQERWEQFLVELAGLMNGPIKELEETARLAWMRWHRVHELAAERLDLDPDRVREVGEHDRVELREALARWHDSTVRADWLARRITGDYRVAPKELRSFYTRWLFYRTEQSRWHAWGEKPTEDPSDWDKVSRAHRAFSGEIETLSERIGTPAGPVLRARAWRRRRREVGEAAAREARRAQPNGD